MSSWRWRIAGVHVNALCIRAGTKLNTSPGLLRLSGTFRGDDEELRRERCKKKKKKKVREMRDFVRWYLRERIWEGVKSFGRLQLYVKPLLSHTHTHSTWGSYLPIHPLLSNNTFPTPARLILLANLITSPFKVPLISFLPRSDSTDRDVLHLDWNTADSVTH